MSNTPWLFYQHDDEGRIWLTERGEGRLAVRGLEFSGVLACAVVHELNEAIQAGRRFGYGSPYTVEDDQVSVQHHPTMPVWPIRVHGLTPEQAQAFAHELHQAGQMGAHT